MSRKHSKRVTSIQSQELGRRWKEVTDKSEWQARAAADKERAKREKAEYEAKKQQEADAGSAEE